MKAENLRSFCSRLLRYEETITLNASERGDPKVIVINSENKKNQNWEKLLNFVPWDEFNEKVLWRLNDHQEFCVCGICGKPIINKRKISKDHIVCKCNGGSYRLFNIQPTCIECNNNRSNKNPGNASPYLGNNQGQVIVSQAQILNRQQGKKKKEKYRRVVRFLGNNALEKTLKTKVCIAR
ncbi:MAG: HNH endonuclease [Alphaproteobacteria bacterium]|nr:HNH endonuclease [Alphaproteobacteria bacterium]